MNGCPMLSPAVLKRSTRDTEAGAAEHWTTPEAYAPTSRHLSIGTIVAAVLASWATVALIAAVAISAIRSAL